MRHLDRVIQRARINQIRPYLPAGSRLLDVGCADGALFRQLDGHIGESVGIDPDLDGSVVLGRHRLLRGTFPDDLPPMPPFDGITMLAVLEHLPTSALERSAKACADCLRPGGRLIITVPSPIVDPILDVLMQLRLIDGMSTHEHHGFDAQMTQELFSVAGFTATVRKRFQLGLNNLFVFVKSPPSLNYGDGS